MARSSSVVLITVDCWRADHAGFLGYRRNTTPFLDQVAGESVVFANAIVAGAPTYYSFPGIMASRHPLAFGRDVVGIAPEEPILATILNQSGYATAAFLAANPYLSPRFGYDAGFDTFRDFLENGSGAAQGGAPEIANSSFRSRWNSYLAKTCHDLGPVGAVYDELYFRYCQFSARRSNQSFESLRRFPSADVIVNEALAWIETIGDQPFFLWLHFMDPHSPYYPKPEALGWMDENANPARACYANSYWNREDITAKRLRGRRNEIIGLYDAGIRWVDSQIGRLVNGLDRGKRWEDCVFAATADHGEEFLEHGRRYHSPATLAEELIHVPLLVRAPGVKPKIHDEPFSLIDLAPSLLNAIGISSPASFRGTSLWNSSREKDSASQPVITESVATCNNPFRLEQRIGARVLAVRESIHKLVIDFDSSQQNLFNLRIDPGELHPLPVDVEKPARRRLLEFARAHITRSLCARDTGQRLDARLRDFRLECGELSSRISA
ncbi:MAG: sulfatase [Terriglobales bacterium]